MSDLLIDSATCTQLVQYYTSPLERNDWDENCARDLTLYLLTAERLKLAPGPGQSGSAAFLYGHLMRQLTSFVSVQSPLSAQLTELGNTQTSKWCFAEHAAIVKAVEDMKASKQFGKWINWTIDYMFEEHARRLSGLFNQEHTRIIARMWNASSNEIDDLQRLTASEGFIKKLSMGTARKDPEFESIVDAFVISSLVRAIFHDSVATAQEAQILHHPYRYFILPSLGKDAAPKSTMLKNDIERLLAEYVLECGWVEKTPEGRIQLWAENVKKIREMYLDRNEPFPSFHIWEDSVRRAREIVRELNLRNYSEAEKKVMDHAWKITSGVLLLGATTILQPTIIEHWPNLNPTAVSIALGSASIVANESADLILAAVNSSYKGGMPDSFARRVGDKLHGLSHKPGGRVNPVKNKHT